MNEAAARVLTLYATVQEIPPAHRGGHMLGREEPTVEDSDYDQALAAVRRRVPKGWRTIALRVERAERGSVPPPMTPAPGRCAFCGTSSGNLAVG